jgi:hypothetical protein
MASRFRWTPLLRLLLGLALVALLVRSVGPDNLRSPLAPLRTPPGWNAAALALTSAALLAGAVRWQAILHALGLPTPFSSTYRGFFIGQFFNAFLFGACGGDLARAIVAARDHPGKRTEAVTSVFLDRAIGLVVTLLAGCALLLPRLRDVAAFEDARPALLLMAAFLLAAVAFATLSSPATCLTASPFCSAWNAAAVSAPPPPRLRRHLPLPEKRPPPARTRPCSPSPISCCCRRRIRRPRRALELDLPFRDLLAVFPVITVLAAIPFTPGSLACAKPSISSSSPPSASPRPRPHALPPRLPRRLRLVSLRRLFLLRQPRSNHD